MFYMVAAKSFSLDEFLKDAELKRRGKISEQH
jgi:hypothetical protein